MPVAALVLLVALASAATLEDVERLLGKHAELVRASQQHARLDLSEDSDDSFDLLYATVAAVRTLDFEEAAKLAGKSARMRSAAAFGGATGQRQLQLLRRLAHASRTGDFGTAASLLGELKAERGHLKLVPDLITLADVWLGWDIGRDQGDAATVAVAARAEEEVGEGEAIFAQLLLVAGDASVSRDDYYSADDGWDFEGLISDLEISRDELAAAAAARAWTAAAAAVPAATKGGAAVEAAVAAAATGGAAAEMEAAAAAAATATTTATAAANAATAAANAASAAVAAAAKGGTVAEAATAVAAVAAATTALAEAEAATAAAKEVMEEEEASWEAEKKAARKVATEKEAEEEVCGACARRQPLCLPACLQPRVIMQDAIFATLFR